MLSSVHWGIKMEEIEEMADDILEVIQESKNVQ